jgi:restriction endonuclease Mrr
MYSFSFEKEQKRKKYVVEGIDFFISELLNKTEDEKLAEIVKQASIKRINELTNKTDKEIEDALNEITENEKKRIKFEAEQRAKGLETYQGNWLPLTEIKRIKEAEIGLQNNFADYSPFEFEEFVAKLFRAMGYSTEVTSKTGDYGIDVIARRGIETIAIQVKHYMEGNHVRNTDVQRLLGSMKLKTIRATHGVLVTTSRFTVQAKVQAEETDVELWDKNVLHQMVRKYLINKTLETKSGEAVQGL